MNDTNENKIHVDADWKAQARAEKEKLAKEAEQQAAESPEGQGGPGQLPPADFQGLVSGLVSQALLYMGAIPDPQTGQRMLHLDLARHHIDLLSVLDAKTQGNLEEEEGKLLTQALQELRLTFVQLSKQVAEQMKKQAEEGGGGIDPLQGGGGGTGPGGIITG